MNTHVKPPAAEVAFATALVHLQSEIKPAIKDTANPAFRGTKYADLGAVWEAVKEPLKAHGFAVIQMPQFEGETMYLETILLHESGEKMTGRYPLKPTKADPQGYGSAITYARRYAICAMLGVIADDDDDGNAASGVNGNGHHKPVAAVKTRNLMDPSQSIAEWALDYCAMQKSNIMNCTTVAEVQEWAESQADDLKELKKHALELWSDLRKFKENRIGNINLGVAAE